MIDCLLFCSVKLTLIVSVVILIALLLPGDSLPDVGSGGLDKFVHFAMFATWAVAVRYDLDRNPFPFLLILVAGISFGVLSELLQVWVDRRTVDFYDMAADAVGVIAGLLISGPIVRFIKRYI